MEVYELLVYILAFIGFFGASYYLVSLVTYYRNKPLDRESTTLRVSVIIPAYNEEKSIERTIESALHLDYPREKFEIIVVNDGSKDRTYELARHVASQHPGRISVFTKKNGGKGSALNVGIKHARGDIVVSMDADSFVQAGALKKMVAFFDDKRVMAVTPSMGVYKPRGILQRIQQIEYYMGVFLRKSFATLNAIHITPGAFSAYRRNFFVRYGGYDEENITEDLEIALRIQSHHYIIENSPHSIVYTIAPRTFRQLYVQRRRWYTGFITNMWHYRSLFGSRTGPLGAIVLPIAVSTIILSIILTAYVVCRAVLQIRDELLLLNSVNFQFENAYELNRYVFVNFFYQVLSSPVFLFGFVFIFLLLLYMHYSRKQMQYTEGLKWSFTLFILLYSLLFALWWSISAVYVFVGRRVVWRESHAES